MTEFFARDYKGQSFELFGTAHINALAFFIILNLLLIRNKNADDKIKHRIRWTLALILWGNEIAWHA